MANDVLRRLLVLVYLVKTLFTLNVCCVIVQVTRNERGDIFTCSTNKKNCYTFNGEEDICRTWNAVHADGEGKMPNKLGLCTCVCSRSDSTFLESDLSCVPNTIMRNKSKASQWTYLLSENKNGLLEPLAVKPPLMVILINFRINKVLTNLGCAQNYSIPYKVELAGKKKWTRIDNFILNKTIVLNKTTSVANLRLQWKKGNISSIRGRVIRIRIKCHFKNDILDDFIIFKINGTLSVNNIPEGTSSLPSFISPSTVIGTTRVASASNQHSIRTSPSALYKSTSFSLISPTIIINIMSLSSANSSTPEKQSKDSSAKAVLTGVKISPTIMSSSSANSSTPEKQSKDSSGKAVLTGAIIGTVLALVIAFLIIFYILRKKKQEQTLSGKLDSGFNNEMTNKNWPSHVLDNPLCQDGAYQSPENVEKYKKRKSGINIDNANYGQCLVVENLSARNIPSLYDNVPEQKSEDAEHTYEPLDPTKREPPSKYQSLIHPENEYSTVSDDVGSTSLQEPIYYSTVDDKAPENLNPKPDPVYNVLEANDSTMQAPSDPVYNVLERSGEVQGKQDPVYSELESK